MAAEGESSVGFALDGFGCDEVAKRFSRVGSIWSIIILDCFAGFMMALFDIVAEVDMDVCCCDGDGVAWDVGCGDG